MKDWVNTFDTISRETWLNQVEKDLRGKSLESLVSEWWPGETLQPLIHSDDADHEVARLPDDLFAKPPLIAEYIQADCACINSDIHEALKFGTQKIIIASDELKNSNLSTWLNGVHLNMVSVELDIEDISTIDPVSLSKQLTQGILLRINCNNKLISDLESLTSKLTGAGIDIESIRFIYSFTSDGIWDQATVATLNLMLNDLEKWISSGRLAGDFFNQTVLKLDCHPTYFKQIIQTRVLHLIWLNLLERFQVEPSGINHDYLESHIESHDIANPDKYLIGASLSGLAASLSGTCSLCIHHLSAPDIKAFYKRSNRNIQHLLHLESNMYQGTDPLAGAYAIDLYTMRWTQRIWQGLNL